MKKKRVLIMIAASMLLLPIAVYAADMAGLGFPFDLPGSEGTALLPEKQINWPISDRNIFNLTGDTPFGGLMGKKRSAEKFQDRTAQAEDRLLAKILLNAAKPAAVTATAAVGEKSVMQEDLLFHQLQALRSSRAAETNVPAEVLYGSIAGRVTNAGDAGIENAQVYIISTGGGSVTNTYTDENGYYTAGGIPTGSYKVYFYGNNTGYAGEWYDDKGYFPDVKDFCAADFVTVTAPDTTSGIDAVLTPGGSIAGRVTNAGDSGIQDIYIEIYSADYDYVTSLYTDADGYYTAAGLPTGSYKAFFYASHVGYISEWYNDQQDFDNANTIAVTAPGATSGIDVVLAQGGSIQGRVKNTSGSGIQNVGVEIHNLDGSLVEYASSVQTGADGSYKVMGLPSGSYKVFFIGNGGYISEWYNDKPDFAGADTVSVTAPNTTTHINAVLALGGSIAGRATNAGGTGIENVYAVIYTTDGYGIAYSYTNADGYYTIGGLTTGSYKVKIHGNNTGYVSEWYNDKPDFDNARHNSGDRSWHHLRH